MSRGTRDTRPLLSTFAYRSLTFYGAAFQHASASFRKLMPGPTTPKPIQKSRPGFRLFPVRSPLLRNRIFFLFLRGTEMVHFPEFASTPYNSGADDPDFSESGSPIRTPPGLR